MGIPSTVVIQPWVVNTRRRVVIRGMDSMDAELVRSNRGRQTVLALVQIVLHKVPVEYAAPV